MTDNLETVWVRKRIAAAIKDGTPAGPLITARAIRDAADEEVAKAVAALRADGYSWTVVGRLLHISKQAAQQKYGSKPRTSTDAHAMPPELEGIDS